MSTDAEKEYIQPEITPPTVGDSPRPNLSIKDSIDIFVVGIIVGAVVIAPYLIAAFYIANSAISGLLKFTP